MIKLEQYESAKRAIDSLATGCNPYNGEHLAHDTILNDSNIARALFIASDALRQVISVGGDISRLAKKNADFFITDEQLRMFEYSSTPIRITEIMNRINKINPDGNPKKITYNPVRNWLVENGYMQAEKDEEGKNRYLPTEKGNQIGIITQMRTGLEGNYLSVEYNADAQHFIIDNFRNILESEKIRNLVK